MNLKVSELQKKIILDDLYSTWRFYRYDLQMESLTVVEKEKLIEKILAIEDLLTQLAGKLEEDWEDWE